MAKQIFATASVLANTTLDVTPSELKTAPYDRILKIVGISGATINTGKLRIIKDQLEIFKCINGVTRTAGNPIDALADTQEVNEIMYANSQLTLLVDNLTGGNLSFYIYIDVEEEQG